MPTRRNERPGESADALTPKEERFVQEYLIDLNATQSAIRAGYSRVYPIGAITRSIQGENLAEMGSMLDAGAVAFTDDGHCLASAEVMRKAMTYSLIFDVPIMQHCEDPELAAGGCMNEGLNSAHLGLPPVPTEAEEVMVVRDLLLADLVLHRVLRPAHVAAHRAEPLAGMTAAREGHHRIEGAVRLKDRCGRVGLGAFRDRAQHDRKRD